MLEGEKSGKTKLFWLMFTYDSSVLIALLPIILLGLAVIVPYSITSLREPGM